MLAVTVARLWLLAALPALTGEARWAARGDVMVAAGAGQGEGPQFASGQRTALLAAAGALGELQCRVLRLGDKAVSWVRSRDLQILAHGGLAFTADGRVTSARRGRGADVTHTLRIQPLRAQDSGRYECQVNTEPKLSLFFNLTVLDEEMPRVEVRAQRAVERGAAGGSATLTCEARYRPAPRALPVPALALAWRRAAEPRPLQSSRGGVSLETERWGDARVRSRLTLAGLAAGDAGAYECVAGPEPELAANVTLLVGDTDDEEPAESMQRDQSPLSAAGGRPLAPALAALAALAMLAR